MKEFEFWNGLAIELNNVAVDLYTANDHSLSTELYKDAIKAMMSTLQSIENRSICIEDESRTKFITHVFVGKKHLQCIKASVPQEQEPKNSILEYYQWSDSDCPIHPKYLSKPMKLKYDDKRDQESFVEINASVMMFNLGLVYMKNMNFEIAEQIFHEALLFKPQDMDKDQVDSKGIFVAILNNLGCFKYRRNQLLKAKNMFSDALSFGDTLRKTSKTCSNKGSVQINIFFGTVSFNLGVTNMCLGTHEKTSDTLKDSLKMNKAALGSDHPDIAFIAHDIGVSYFEYGKIDRAIDSILESLRVKKIHLGNMHPLFVKDLFFLGKMYEFNNKFSEALCIFKETLRLQRMMLGTNHPGTILALCKISETYHKIGGWEKALEVYNDALIIIKTAKLVRPDILGLVYCRISKILFENGQFEKSVRIFSKAKTAIELANKTKNVVNPEEYIELQALLVDIPSASAA